MTSSYGSLLETDTACLVMKRYTTARFRTAAVSLERSSRDSTELRRTAHVRSMTSNATSITNDSRIIHASSLKVTRLPTMKRSARTRACLNITSPPDIAASPPAHVRVAWSWTRLSPYLVPAKRTKKSGRTSTEASADSASSWLSSSHSQLLVGLAGMCGREFSMAGLELSGWAKTMEAPSYNTPSSLSQPSSQSRWQSPAFYRQLGTGLAASLRGRADTPPEVHSPGETTRSSTTTRVSCWGVTTMMKYSF
jgi:hypothetical protein